MSEYDRILATAMRELEPEIERMVEREFKAARERPGEVAEIPWTGEKYDPHAPPEAHVASKRRTVRALLAKEWFKHEAPEWAGALPLRLEDCQALFNGTPAEQTNHRRWLVGKYGIALRGMGWDYRRAPPFELFCAHALAP